MKQSRPDVGRLTEADVARLLALKERVNGQDEDWVIPNRIKNGRTMKPGPIWHETLLARRIQPVARELGLPHITWRLLRHRGATQMVGARVPLKAAQQRLEHLTTRIFSSPTLTSSTSRRTPRWRR